MLICADFVTKVQCKKNDADNFYANIYQNDIVWSYGYKFLFFGERLGL